MRSLGILPPTSHSGSCLNRQQRPNRRSTRKPPNARFPAARLAEESGDVLLGGRAKGQSGKWCR